jgi:TonB family protein
MDNGDKLLKKPTYKGGNRAMSQFIKKNIKYPKKALERKVEGVVSVRIDIDKHGKVKKAKAIKKLGSGCDEEAERVAGLLEFFVDSKRKVKLTFHKTINVTFRLPKAKKVAPPKKETTTSTGMQIVYTYVPSKKKGN